MTRPDFNTLPEFHKRYVQHVKDYDVLEAHENFFQRNFGSGEINLRRNGRAPICCRQMEYKRIALPHDGY